MGVFHMNPLGAFERCPVVTALGDAARGSNAPDGALSHSTRHPGLRPDQQRRDFALGYYQTPFGLGYYQTPFGLRVMTTETR